MTEMPDEQSKKLDVLKLTSFIFAAYVRKNPIPVADIPAAMRSIYRALLAISRAPPETHDRPAVPVKKSVTRDHIICLEDGKQMKLLRRHLREQHGLSPDQYREKWKLPRTYPMTAPNYAAARSSLAKKSRLGRR